MNNKLKNLLTVLLVLTVLFFVITWRIGLLGLWSEGISYIASNTEDFRKNGGQVIKGSYTLSIDLTDLNSSIGKEIYNDGEHKITVEWINKTGNTESEGLNIGFRSFGDYSLDGASLISGVHHITNNDLSFSSEMSAKLTAQYNSKIYNGTVSGIAGLNYKSGDDFSFDIYAPEAISGKGEIEITLTNLYMNIWTKKK